MIQIMVKAPEEAPQLQQIGSMDELSDLIEGEYEMVQDDLLPGIHIMIDDEARGIKPHNFTIQTEGSHDWIYGTAVFICLSEDNRLSSLTNEQAAAIQDYFAKTRAYS